MGQLRGFLPVTASSREMSSFRLLFTDERIIVARTGPSPEMVRLTGALGGALGGAVGGAVAGAAGRAMRKGIQEKTLAQTGMTPDEILRSDRRNWEIPYSRVERLMLKSGLTGCRLTLIYSEGRKEWFELRKSTYPMAKMVLASLFGAKLQANP